jgi:hypothetical protein
MVGEAGLEFILVFNGEINMRNGNASLGLKRLTQVVERNTMMMNIFDTKNSTTTSHCNSGDSPRFHNLTETFNLSRE